MLLCSVCLPLLGLFKFLGVIGTMFLYCLTRFDSGPLGQPPQLTCLFYETLLQEQATNCNALLHTVAGSWLCTRISLPHLRTGFRFTIYEPSLLLRCFYTL